MKLTGKSIAETMHGNKVNPALIQIDSFQRSLRIQVFPISNIILSILPFESV